jgi:plastocyanin
MVHRRSLAWLLLVPLAGGALAASALGADEPANRPGPTWAEFQRLQNEVREQRQLILQLMQTEQQRYDMLLKLIQSGGRLDDLSKALPPATPPGAAAPGETRAGAATAGPHGAGAKDSASARRLGAIEGRVNVPGGDTDAVYVYVADVRQPRVRGKRMEIKQENKQFIPRHAVVQVGTTVSFPNLDPIFHNVFSNSPRNSFDLGAYGAGDAPRSAVMSHPGVVDVYCNMHQRMSASVLVVPNRLWTKVRPDGTFRLEGIPPGTRSVVAWAPSLKPAQKKVDVAGTTPARADFDLEYTEQRTHVNKFGQPYGSYKE